MRCVALRRRANSYCRGTSVVVRRIDDDTVVVPAAAGGGSSSAAAASTSAGVADTDVDVDVDVDMDMDEAAALQAALALSLQASAEAETPAPAVPTALPTSHSPSDARAGAGGALSPTVGDAAASGHTVSAWVNSVVVDNATFLRQLEGRSSRHWRDVLATLLQLAATSAGGAGGGSGDVTHAAGGDVILSGLDHRLAELSATLRPDGDAAVPATSCQFCVAPVAADALASHEAACGYRRLCCGVCSVCGSVGEGSLLTPVGSDAVCHRCAAP
jgi:hypothetical protein